MAEIRITRAHQSDVPTARAAAERAAQLMSEKYQIDYRWEGDELHFQRPGVDGVMQISADRIDIQAQLGFFLAMLKGPIEQEIEKQLDEYFA